MASSNFICSHQIYSSCNGKTHFNSFKKASFSIPSSYKFQHASCFERGFRYSRIRATASDSKTGKKQVEVVYDLEDKFSKLADEVDKNSGMSRLTLFSPCKINVFLRITGKREDGYHDLASLFHVISLGDKIKFSLSPSKSSDRLSTNVPGVPLDDRNLPSIFLGKRQGLTTTFGFILTRRCQLGQGLVVVVVMPPQLCGQQISLAAVLPLKRNSKNGQAKLVRISRSFFLTERPTVRVEIVEDILKPLPFDVPLVLIKPQEACSTAEVYKRLTLDRTSTVDPLTLLEKISRSGISQDVCINDLEPPAFEVLPSLKRLKQRLIAAGRGQYDSVFMSGSGSTIVGVGSPDPPQFIYDDDEYKDVFLSEASFITRAENQWYTEVSMDAASSPMEFSV